MADDRAGRRRAAFVGAACAGMTVFALFSHRPYPASIVAAAGLLATVAAVGLHAFDGDGAADVLGVARPSVRSVSLAAAGLGLGAAGAVAHRASIGLPDWPGPIQPFAVVACAVGATEELLYRGWVLGSLRRSGRAWAITASAAAHAAYKTALFAWPATSDRVDLGRMGVLTFLAGVVLGLLRVAGGGLAAPVVAHAAFDLLVYGAVASSPWWLWG